ncbi:MAG: hypothetical protein ACOY3Y_08465, partial [Acidobacteriota bacterium]
IGAWGDSLTSPDGITWTLRTIQPATFLTGLAWTGTELVAVGGRADPLAGGKVQAAILASADGMTWQPRSSSLATSLTAVCVNGPILLAVGGEPEPAITTSADGITWTARSSSTTLASLRSIAWTGSRFIAVGDDATIITSEDGQVWAPVQAPDHTGGLHTVIWAGWQLVALSDRALLTSRDGLSWQITTFDDDISISALAWTGSILAGVGAGGRIVTSLDAVTWVAQVSGTTGHLSGVAWTGSQLVAVGESGTVLTSPDGIRWTPRNAGTDASFSSVVSNGQLVAAAAVDRVFTSTDATNWTSHQLPGLLYGLAWTAGQFVAITAPGVVLTSDDCASWAARTFLTTTPLLAAAASASHLVAVGAEGTILASECAPGCSEPAIVSALALEQRLLVGESASLPVLAAGSQPLACQWYTGFPGDTSIPVTGDGCTLVTPPLVATTRYWVRASNACGHADSAWMTLLVDRPVRRHLGRR